MKFSHVTYTIVLERADTNWSAFAPDVPGCAATGLTRVHAIENIKNALEFHFDGTLEDGLKIPVPTADASRGFDDTCIVEIRVNTT